MTKARRKVTALAVAVALVLPSVLIWGWYVALARGGVSGPPNPLQQVLYVVSKAVQLAFPLLFVRAIDGRWPRPRRPRREGLGLGLGFGVLVGCGILVLYYAWLAGGAMLRDVPPRLAGKVDELGVRAPAALLGMALFLAVAHSLLEEYYWRWFVYGRLRGLVSDRVAVVVSSLGFTAHHVVILNVLLPGQFMTAVLPLSLGVAVGGVFWCWLYGRTGSLWWAWLGHVLIDAALLAVAWDLLQRGGA
jgi:membrane protease YdiL (CAAX protease family)